MFATLSLGPVLALAALAAPQELVLVDELPAVDLETLYGELLDRRTPFRKPGVAHAARFSIATSEGPDDEGSAQEQTLFELEGPGAVVRLGTPAPDGILRMYVDGNAQPSVVESFSALREGAAGLPAPLAVVHPGGASLLAAVPFAKSCRVTIEAAEPVTVALQWRKYTEAAAVRSLQPGEWNAAKPGIAALAAGASAFEYGHGSQSFKFGKVVSASGTGGTSKWNAMSIATAELGPQMVSELRVGPLNADDPQLLVQLLRQTTLSITFDDLETVFVPLGDFFGSAPGITPHSGRAFTVTPDGVFTCRLPMPFKSTCFIRIEAQMDVPFAVPAVVTIEPNPWTEDTLYFHSTWRYEPYLESPPTETWQLAQISGRGVLVGEALTVGSRGGAWRAGRARIVADGQGHRSWGVLEGLGLPVDLDVAWWSDLASVARATGPEGDGWTTLVRTRTLDRVPFTSELRYELGCDFPETPLRSYAATTWFYADADARLNLQPVRELSQLGISPPD